jgi:L,D-transpeptidase YcbB
MTPLKNMVQFLLVSLVLTGPAQAGPAIDAPAEAVADSAGNSGPYQEPDAAPATPVSAEVLAISAALRAVVADRPQVLDDGLSADHDAMQAFYDARAFEPMWMTDGSVSDAARALAAEIANGAAYGLNPDAFRLPKLDDLKDAASLARAEFELTLAALTYARHARGGRIPHPAEQLNSNLDRKPQLHDPKVVLDRLAGADDVAHALTAMHPVHPQFERLRQAFLEASEDGNGGGKLNTAAKRLRANMEFWRWMWDDLGELHVFNNIPEFMQYVYRDGEVIRSERIVVGLIDKPTSVFSRQLRDVALRPQWRVPESIMVHDIWPSLLRGGGYMRQYGLTITTKAGEPRDWRKIDWSKDDIRNYHVWQPPGPRSVLGRVKFSFPSQHTIFMHDTPDKWMFNSKQRTLSHGCLRVRNPMDLAEIVLAYDKGWDRAKIEELSKSGPLNNEIKIDKRLPIHLAYFTAWVDDDGKLRTFHDIYGHEKRVTQALDGEWNRINKGRNHLAPVKPRFNPAKIARERPSDRRRKANDDSVADVIGTALGGLF